MLNFQQKNHSFRTIDLLGLILLVGAVGSISGAIIAQTLHDDKPQRARSMTEALARQIHADQISTNKTILASSRMQRGPASVEKPVLTSGELGHDPWGHPFHYSVRKSSKGRPMTRIYVWSDGANEKSETDPAAFDDAINANRFTLGGDDIGYVEEFPTDS